jgi:DNA replication protein DnaD
MKEEPFDIRNYEKTAKILETIASQYPKTSEEYHAIEIAAKALMFACESKAWDRFEKFLEEFGEKLTPKQIEHLQKMGILSENMKPLRT